jgi:hypothetical protein
MRPHPKRASRRRLADAMVNLAVVVSRLRELRREALLGGRYDPDEYDRAVLAERTAQAEIEATRLVAPVGASRRQRARAGRQGEGGRPQQPPQPSQAA